MKTLTSKKGPWQGPKRHRSFLSMLFAVFFSVMTISNLVMLNKTPVTLNLETLSNENIKIEDAVSESLPLPAPGGDKGEEQQEHRFAYAFLIAGCKPETPSYRGYIYNVAIAREILTEFNSTADVVVMVRMHADTNQAVLPPADEDILTKAGVIVKYIPKVLTDNFHTAMMDKFRILEMTEYDRVLYLDSDVLPLNNLDYIFDKSVGPEAILEENLVLAFNHEPASGGFFMLKPDKEDYQEITKLIQKRENEGYHFNETIGFGHIITPPDYWESLKKKGNLWSFYGAFTDQGLLYHWTKYAKKKVTVVAGTFVQTWMANENGDTVMIREESTEAVFGDVKQYTSINPLLDNGMSDVVPYRDFKHFVTKSKPWLKRAASNPPKEVENIYKAQHPVQLWYHLLRRLNNKYKLGIDPEKMQEQEPILGLYPTFAQVMNANDDRKKKE